MLRRHPGCGFTLWTIVIDPGEAIRRPYLTEKKHPRVGESFNVFHVGASCNRFPGAQSIIRSTFVINFHVATRKAEEERASIEGGRPAAFCRKRI